jgi:hypothetical protein
MRTRKSKKDKQYYVYSGYNKKDKRTNNDLQNITQKTKDRVTRIYEATTHTHKINKYVLHNKPTVKFSKYFHHLYIFAEKNIFQKSNYEAKIFGVFRVKNHDFTPKNHIFFQFESAPGVTRIPLRVMLDQIIYNKIYHNTAV